jgi:hypothetical protein
MRVPRSVLGPLAAGLLSLAALAPFAVADGAPGLVDVLCGAVPAGQRCEAGNGRQTPGGGEKVSHAGWPAVTGILWKVTDGGDARMTGGPANDELLGHHGSDVVDGGAGDDILWGDWDPSGNTTGQHDVLRGGPGDDWIYPSHGRTEVLAGPGNDHVWAFYGHGTIDCGPGVDTVRVRMNGAFTLRNCERIQHFCAFGADGHGGCRKPGSRRAVRALRRG